MAATRDSETARRSSGRTDQPLEDELVEEFKNTVQEGTDRLHRTWRALVVTGLFGGIDVGLGIMAMLAVMDATGSKLLAGTAFGIGLLALRLAHSGSPATPDQTARLTAARTAFDELTEAYEAIRRMVERGYVTLKG